MADVKISQLPASTTPLDGTEVLPIVQSATTKQVSVANLTAGRAVSALSLSLTNALPVSSGGTGLQTTGAGTFLVSATANNVSATATPSLGVASTTSGTLSLYNSGSANAVTIASGNNSGAWTFTLPTSGGTNNYILTTNGSGTTQWTNPTALGIDLNVGTTVVSDGTSGRILYNNAGVLGEYSSVPVSFGGTGLTSLTAGYIPYGNGTGAFSNNANLYFDGTNLGVGGVTPVTYGVQFVTYAAGNVEVAAITGGASYATYRLQNSTNRYSMQIRTDESNAWCVRDETNSANRLILSTGGNLGLGVTPSAWDTYKSLELPAQGYISSGAGWMELMSNAYYGSGAYRYKSNGYASHYLQQNSSHQWFTAASGSAGGTISFTQAMTLDASGNLGVGTSSPYNAANFHGISIDGSTGSTFYMYYGGTRGMGGYVTSASGVFGTVTSIPLAFTTGDAERVRIDASGNLLVGTTSAGTAASIGSVQAQTIQGNAGTSFNNVVLSGVATNTSFTSNVLDIECARNTTNSTYNLIAAACQGVAYRFYVRDSGDVVNTNNSYGAISDVKLKENIADATPKLDDLLKVKVRNFNWKEDQVHKQIGVIAQELEEVFPSMIEETIDRDKDGVDLGTTTKSVKYSVFTPIIIKAIQELAAKVSALEARQ